MPAGRASAAFGLAEAFDFVEARRAAPALAFGFAAALAVVVARAFDDAVRFALDCPFAPRPPPPIRVGRVAGREPRTPASALPFRGFPVFSLMDPAVYVSRRPLAGQTDKVP